MALNKYLPRTSPAKLAWVVEECGEVCAAIGKTERNIGPIWTRLAAGNPELRENLREMNGDWILRELQDLKQAINLLEEDLRARGFTGAKPVPKAKARKKGS